MKRLVPLLIVLLTLVIPTGVHAQLNMFSNAGGTSLGYTIISTENNLKPGLIVLTAKVALDGRPITAAAPDTGPFTVPCGLRGGDLIMNVQLIAEQLKLIRVRDSDGLEVADIKVKYSLGGAYREAEFDVEDGWFATIPLDRREPDVKVVTFDVLYRAGRNYVKLFSFITLSATDARNRVQAARTMAFAEYDRDLPEDKESVWKWQVLMGGATITGQALPAGGVAPLFTPASVRDAMFPPQQQLPPLNGGQGGAQQGGDLILTPGQAQGFQNSMGNQGTPPNSESLLPYTATEATTREGKSALRISKLTKPITVIVTYARDNRRQTYQLRPGQAILIEEDDTATIVIEYLDASGIKVSKTVQEPATEAEGDTQAA